jgi:hypothetical protein
LRRLGMVTLARDERRLRFCSSRPIVCGVDGGLVRVGVGDSNLPSPYCCAAVVDCPFEISQPSSDKPDFRWGWLLIESPELAAGCHCQPDNHHC